MLKRLILTTPLPPQNLPYLIIYIHHEKIFKIFIGIIIWNYEKKIYSIFKERAISKVIWTIVIYLHKERKIIDILIVIIRSYFIMLLW